MKRCAPAESAAAMQSRRSTRASPCSSALVAPKAMLSSTEPRKSTTSCETIATASRSHAWPTLPSGTPPSVMAPRPLCPISAALEPAAKVKLTPRKAAESCSTLPAPSAAEAAGYEKQTSLNTVSKQPLERHVGNNSEHAWQSPEGTASSSLIAPAEAARPFVSQSPTCMASSDPEVSRKASAAAAALAQAVVLVNARTQSFAAWPAVTP
eukprot:2655779-Pleurochrysis_carterae.AAC.2